MVVRADSSIVPDSTISSSPTTPTSPVIKRSNVTYGRRKDVQLRPDPDSSATLAESSSSSRPSLYSAGHSDVEEEVPPSSSALNLSESSSATRIDDDAETIYSNASRKDKNKWVDHTSDGNKNTTSQARRDDAEVSEFRFSWKDDLKKIDEVFDDDSQAATLPDSSGGPRLGAAGDKEMDALPSLRSQPPSPKPAFDGVFGASLSGSSQSHSLAVFHPSPSVSPDRDAILKRPRKRAVRIDSDDDMGDLSFDSPLKASHPINTPKSRSSPTPPTSDISTSDAKSQKKSKAAARGIPPLTFDNTQESDSESPHATMNAHIGKRKSKESRSKIKPPTKKEVRETHIDKQRIIADKKVQIPRLEGPSKYNLKSLFDNLSGKAIGGAQAASTLSSDPIQPFSSSPEDASRPPEFGVPSKLLAVSKTSPSRGLSESLVATRLANASVILPELDDTDDEEDLPSAKKLFADDERRRRAQQLIEFKKQALAIQQVQGPTNPDDDDDDLVVTNDMHAVADEEAEERRARQGKHIRPSEGKKRQLLQGGVGSSKADKGHKDALGRMKSKDGLDLLRDSAKNAFSGTKHGKDELKQETLNQWLMEQADRDNAKTSKLKEEEWTRKGGKAVIQVKAVKVDQRELAAMAAERRAQTEIEAADVSDGDDSDWVPELRGSASPEPMGTGSGEEEDVEDGAASEAEVAMDVQTDQEDEEMEDKENSRPRKPRRSVVHRTVLDSDEDDDAENVRPLQSKPSMGRVLVPDTSFAEDSGFPLQQMPNMVHRGSLSSFDEPTEDENDKENNTQLMFDKSEDKENKAVVRHSPLAGRPVLGTRIGSLFGLEEGIARTLSMSPSVTDEDGDKPRKPLKELRDDDEDPFAFSPGTSFAKKLQRSSSSQVTPGPLLPLLFGGQGSLNFSQFLGDEGDRHSAVIATSELQPGFSQISRSTSDASILPFRAPTSGGFSQWSEEQNDSGLDRLRKLDSDANEFSLTLDVGLQPALEVDENLRRQADAIFDKEQACLVEVANRKPKAKQELYVNDHGFLTQTRPDVDSPEVYRVASPSQTQVGSTQGLFKDFASQSTQRRPLRTISVGDILESPVGGSLKRLRRRDASPVEATFNSDYRSTPSPSPPKRPRNAFDDLLKGQARKTRAEKKQLVNSEYVQAEAQESDDDDQFGFGGHKKKDDGEEDDGEDQDKTLEELVDDAEMDEETIAEDLVLEKVKEHQEEDDKAIEKVHRDAIEGKMRVKRRGGVGLDSDDSDDDDDDDDSHNRRIRRQIAKKRRIDGDTMQELAAHDATKAFVAEYQKDLEDDNAEFAHLLESAPEQDVTMHSDDDENADESREIVSVHEVRRQARAMATIEDAPEPIDPRNVDWIDDEDEEDARSVSYVAVKTVGRRIGVPRPHQNYADIDIERSMPVLVEPAGMKEWARRESKTRNPGTGRSVVGSAVTGHKAKVKTGGGSLRSLPSSSASAVAPASRKPTKAASMLSVVSDKSSRFG